MQSDNPSLVLKRRKKKSNRDEDIKKQLRINIQKVLLTVPLRRNYIQLESTEEMYNIESDLIR